MQNEQQITNPRFSIEPLNLTIEPPVTLEGNRNFKIMHRVNIIVSIILTLIYFSVFGLMLMPIQGMMQVVISIIILFHLQKLSPLSKKLFVIYMSIAIPLILCHLFLLLNLYTSLIKIESEIFFGLVGASYAVSIYHIIVTHKIKTESHDAYA